MATLQSELSPLSLLVLPLPTMNHWHDSSIYCILACTHTIQKNQLCNICYAAPASHRKKHFTIAALLIDSITISVESDEASVPSLELLAALQIATFVFESFKSISCNDMTQLVTGGEHIQKYKL